MQPAVCVVCRVWLEVMQVTCTYQLPRDITPRRVMRGDGLNKQLCPQGDNGTQVPYQHLDSFRGQAISTMLHWVWVAGRPNRRANHGPTNCTLKHNNHGTAVVALWLLVAQCTIAAYMVTMTKSS